VAAREEGKIDINDEISVAERGGSGSLGREMKTKGCSQREESEAAG